MSRTPLASGEAMAQKCARVWESQSMGRCRKELSVSSLSDTRLRTAAGVFVFLPPILKFTLRSSRNRSLWVSFGFSEFPEKQEGVMRYPSC